MKHFNCYLVFFRVFFLILPIGKLFKRLTYI